MKIAIKKYKIFFKTIINDHHRDQPGHQANQETPENREAWDPQVKMGVQGDQEQREPAENQDQLVFKDKRERLVHLDPMGNLASQETKEEL